MKKCYKCGKETPFDLYGEEKPATTNPITVEYVHPIGGDMCPQCFGDLADIKLAKAKLEEAEARTNFAWNLRRGR